MYFTAGSYVGHSCLQLRSDMVRCIPASSSLSVKRGQWHAHPAVWSLHRKFLQAPDANHVIARGFAHAHSLEFCVCENGSVSGEERGRFSVLFARRSLTSNRESA